MAMFSKLIRFWLFAVTTMLALGMSVAWAGDLEDGLAAGQAKDYEKALQLLRPLAEKGEARAQSALGIAYFNGLGVSINSETGVMWARRAADQGDADGQNSIGYSYRAGRGGLPKDYDQALKWLRLAAAQGNAAGQVNLGDMYLQGLGVSRNYDEAVILYRLAAAQGMAGAQGQLGYMYRNGFGVTRDYDEALRLFRLSAAPGYRHGQFHVGYMYFNGFGVTRDYDEALKWFRLAAAQSQADAQDHIGWMYEAGLGVNLDIEEAARWYLKAAAQGYEAAKKKLESTWSMKSAAERATAADALRAVQKPNAEVARDRPPLAAADKDNLRVAEDARVKEQDRLSQIAKVKEQERLAQEAAAREQERVAQEARTKEQELLAQVAKVKEQERLTQEARAREQERLAQAAKAREQERSTQAAKAKEQERLTQEAKVREQERLAQEERVKTELLLASRQRDEEVVKLRQQLAKLEDEKTSRDQKATFAVRRALVIGNDSYKQVAKLVNAREDARSIASSLQQVGYQVTLKLDVTEKEMKAALRTFKDQVEGGDEVLVFFAGHGLQLGAANYLLPIDIAGDSEEQIKDDAIQLQRMLDDMSERKAKFTLAMIDACRDNPFKTAGRAIAGGRGLAPTTAATGQMVIFSAGAGQQAMDKLGPTDTNKNGLFTRVFLKEMQKPGVSVDRVVRNVRNEVVGLAKSVGHEQVPAIYDQVVGEFYFRR